MASKLPRERSFSDKKSKGHIIYLLIALFLVGYVSTKYWVDLSVHKRRGKYDIRMLPTPNTARWMAFGFEPVLADIYWIEGLNYFGSELTNKQRTYTYLDEYVELIQALDPLFTTFYEWASTVFIYNGLEVNRDNIRRAVKYANAGILNLSKFHRYNPQMIIKNAFNFGLELHDYRHAIDYFLLAGRSFTEHRDMLLVASTYAGYDNNQSLAAQLRLEYLGHIAFEAQDREQLLYALRLLASQKTNERTGEFVRALRLKMEADEDVRKLVERRLSDSPMLKGVALSNQDLHSDPRIENVLRIDFTKTWMPAELLALVSL